MREYTRYHNSPNKPNKFNLLMENFCAITGLSKQDLRQKSEEELLNNVNLDENLKEVLGKTYIYHGLGKDLDVDRLYIREQLRGLMTRDNRRFLLESVTLYLPCSILSSYNEILDAPGTGDIDTLNKHLLYQQMETTSNLFMVIPRSLKECEALKILMSDSPFLDNLIKEPQNHSIIIINYREKNNSYNLDQFISKRSAEEEISSKVISITTQVLFDDFAERVSEERARELIDQTVRIFCVRPLLFTSILLDSEEVAKLVSQDVQIEQELTRTNGYRLLGTFRDIQHRSCYEEVKDMIKLLTNKHKTCSKDLCSNLKDIDSLGAQIMKNARSFIGDNERLTRDSKQFFDSISKDIIPTVNKLREELTTIIKEMSIDLQKNEDIASDLTKFCNQGYDSMFTVNLLCMYSSSMN